MLPDPIDPSEWRQLALPGVEPSLTPEQREEGLRKARENDRLHEMMTRIDQWRALQKHTWDYL